MCYKTNFNYYVIYYTFLLFVTFRPSREMGFIGCIAYKYFLALISRLSAEFLYVSYGCHERRVDMFLFYSFWSNWSSRVKSTRRSTRRRFIVVSTLFEHQQRCYNVETTSCAYWDESSNQIKSSNVTLAFKCSFTTCYRLMVVACWLLVSFLYFHAHLFLFYIDRWPNSTLFFLNLLYPKHGTSWSANYFFIRLSYKQLVTLR